MSQRVWAINLWSACGISIPMFAIRRKILRMHGFLMQLRCVLSTAFGCVRFCTLFLPFLAFVYAFIANIADFRDSFCRFWGRRRWPVSIDTNGD